MLIKIIFCLNKYLYILFVYVNIKVLILFFVVYIKIGLFILFIDDIVLRIFCRVGEFFFCIGDLGGGVMVFGLILKLFFDFWLSDINMEGRFVKNE